MLLQKACGSTDQDVGRHKGPVLYKPEAMYTGLSPLEVRCEM